MRNGVQRFYVFLTGAMMSIAAPVALPQTAAPSAAPAYPTKPIRLIVPYAPGGGADFLARTLGQKLGESLRESIVVDNRAGAGGMVGANMVAKAAPDGYTLLFPSSAHTIIPSLVAKVPYDSVKDFAPVTQATSQAYILDECGNCQMGQSSQSIWRAYGLIFGADGLNICDVPAGRAPPA